MKFHVFLVKITIDQDFYHEEGYMLVEATNCQDAINRAFIITVPNHCKYSMMAAMIPDDKVSDDITGVAISKAIFHHIVYPHYLEELGFRPYF